MQQTTDAFRFLDLPKELRLMIYDRIPCVNDHLTLARREWSFFAKKQPLHRDHSAAHGDADSDKPVVIVVPTPAGSILATCRAVHDEALPILRKRRNRPDVRGLRILCGAEFLDVFSQQGGLLDMLLNWTAADGSAQDGTKQPERNGCVQDWLLGASLVTAEDTKHPQYPVLTHIIDTVQRDLSSPRPLPIEISLLDRNLHMLEQFLEVFYWRAMEKKRRAVIRLGMAGPRYCVHAKGRKRWEDTLSYVLRDLDDAMDMRSLVYGTTSEMRVLRAPRLEAEMVGERWEGEWGLGR